MTHKFKSIHSYGSLDKHKQKLIDEAIKSREFAYSPYSNFKVGSAALCSSGNIYTGCNVENASFGLTICAERTALVKAVSGGHLDIVAIAVAAQQGDQFVAPCGACRQFIHEFSKNNNIEVLLVNTAKGNVAVTDIRELLPFGFFL